MTFVAINAIEQNIAMTAANNTAELLEQLRPARNNMAVVEPVAIPILLEPPNIVFRFYFANKIMFECYFYFYRLYTQFKLIMSPIIWILMLWYVSCCQH
jgi:hypothetical protein